MAKKKENEDDLLEIKLKKETKLYWARAVSAALSALFGRLFFGLIGWPMFFWMLFFWFGFPFIISFLILRYPYDKEEWNWKIILKTGIGIFFFTFMVVGTLVHTILYFVT